MRSLKRFSLVATIVLMMSVFLVGCGASNPLEGDAAVGTWEMTGAEYAGMTLTADDLKSAMKGGLPEFVINEDGSAVFTFNGADGEGNVTKNEDGSYTLSDDSEETIDFTIEDSKLLLDYEDMNMTMIFEK